MLRDRLGAQAQAEGHGVTPLAYGVVGAILVAAGAFYARRRRRLSRPSSRATLDG